MRFNDWIEEWGKQSPENTQLRFAKLAKMSPAMVTKLLNGSIPGKRIMKAIGRVTGGLVQANDFYQ